MDQVLTQPKLQPLIEQFGRGRVKAQIQTLQSQWRQQSAAVPSAAIDLRQPDQYVDPVAQQLKPASYQPVFNLTGTTIHTNLGRSLLSQEIWDEVAPLVTQPMNLEFDLTTGRRGQREAYLAERLCRLTGAEAACLVNNNAAALMLTLNTFALNKPVPVSRGELIEIGGSFRLPELMTRSGCELVEVGSTNRTHLADYAAAIDDNTALLLKVHPSNFEIQGFTQSVALVELAQLALQHQLPLVEDLGSGSLIDLTRFGLPAEPTPQQSLKAGADLVTFSGDKLLGGVQAGIIVGKADLVAQLNKNPLKRALRLDKVALALLDALLKRYESSETVTETIPLLTTLTTTTNELLTRAKAVSSQLQTQLSGSDSSLCVETKDTDGQIGSGALPTRPLPSIAVAISGAHSPRILLRALRELPVPVIGRIHNNALWLDMRGATDLDALLANLKHLTPDLLSS